MISATVRRMLPLLALGLTAAPVAAQLTVSATSFTFFKGSSAISQPSVSFLFLGNTANVPLTGVGVGPTHYGAGQPTGWLNVSVPSTTIAAGGGLVGQITATATLQVLNGTGGTLTADFDVVSTNGGSQHITVSFVVMPATLSASTTSLSLNTAAGSQFAVFNDGGVNATGVSVGTPTYGAGQPNGWLGISFPYTSLSPGQVATGSVGIVGQSLAPGTYSASFTISAANVPGSLTFSVTLTVNAGAPRIVVSATSLSFATVERVSPQPQFFAVTNGGGGFLAVALGTITYGTGQPSGWLSATLSGSAAPATITVQPSANGLPQGSYSATLPVSSSSSGVTNSPQTVNVTLTVSPAPVATVSVALGSSTLDVGAQTQAIVTLRDILGVALTGRAITYSSNDASVATVSASGVVTGVSPGSTAVFATSEGKTGGATVTVRAAAPVATVSVALAKSSLTVGGQTQATATLKDGSGAVLSGRTITWASSNTSVASVSSVGVVTALSAGAATIVATSEGQSGTAAITVSEPLPVIVLDRTAVSMTAQAAESATSNVTVTNGIAGSLGGLAVTVAGVTPGAPVPAWMSAKLSSASAPATLQLTADASRLAPSSYSALVTVSSPSTSGVAPQTVNVTLVVSEPSQTAVLKDLLATLTPGGTSALSAEIRQYLDQRGNNNGQFDVGDILAYFDRTGAVLDRATLDAVRSARPAAAPASKHPLDSLKVRQP